MRNPSRRRQKALRRFLGIKTGFYRVTPQRHIRLRQAQSMALRRADLKRGQIQACYHLCHGMFDLKARIHFEKEKFAICVQKKLNRARTDVIN